MSAKRTLPILLILTALLGLFASACCFDPYYYRPHHRRGGHHRGGHHRGGHHRRASIEQTIPAPGSPAAEAAAR